MKFLDIFGFILLAVLLLVVGMLMVQGQAWTLGMKGTAFWFTQALAYALTIVGVTCAITGKKIRELSNTSVTWVSILVVVIALIGIIWINQAGREAGLMWYSIFELIAFYAILISLFLIPRHSK